ncbi:MAG: hypothetical protein CFE29_18040 [Bradyrhizobiaceae bacterium PARB1]|nr:MAG: hypothetical protein CFE29_18040 [Bradyrhizobiaceae bacterium PARB1]
MRKFFAVLASAWLSSTIAVQADAFPSRPITIIVPYSAGGPTDIVGRLIADSMSDTLKTRVLIENMGGAGGTRGAGLVARAAPDGYTLLLHNIGHATSASLYRKLPYSPTGDFEAIGLITDVPMTIIGRQSLEANSFAEFVALLRAQSSKINFGHAGVGSAAHLCSLLLMASGGIQVTSIPYQGSSQSLRDIVAGQIDIGCDQTTNTMNQIRSGQVKAFAVTTFSRLGSMPDIPTAHEAGLKDFEITVWHGLYAPKGTSEAILLKMNTALRIALRDPRVVARFAELGTEPVTEARMSRDVHSAFVASEVGKWRTVIEAAGAFVD